MNFKKSIEKIKIPEIKIEVPKIKVDVPVINVAKENYDLIFDIDKKNK